MADNKEQFNIDIQVTGLADFKRQLKESKSELLALQSQAESGIPVDTKRIDELNEKVGKMTDLMAKTNEQIKVMAGGSEFEKVSNGIGLVSDQLSNLDFAGASESVKQLKSNLTSLNPAKLKEEFNDFKTAISGMAQVVGKLSLEFIQMGAKLLLNPIFLLGAAVTAIVVSLGYFIAKLGIVSSIMDSIKTAMQPVIDMFKSLTDFIGFTSYAIEDSVNKQTKAFDKQKTSLDKSSEALSKNQKYAYDLAKANGASSEELRKLSVKHAEEAAALNLKNTMIARTIFLRERDRLATLEATNASDEAIAAQKKLTQDVWNEFEKQRTNYYTSKQNIKEVEKQGNIEIAQEATDARKKRNDEINKESQERKEKRKKDLAEIAKIEADANNFVDDIGKTARQKELEGVDDKYKSQLALLEKYGKDTTNLKLKIETEKDIINKKYNDKELQDKKDFLNKYKLEEEKFSKIRIDNAEKQAIAQALIEGKSVSDIAKIRLYFNQLREKQQDEFWESLNIKEKTYADMNTSESVKSLQDKNNKQLEEDRTAAVNKATELGLSQEQILAINEDFNSKKEANDKEAAEREKEIADIKVNTLFSIAQNGVGMLDNLTKIGIIKGKAAQTAQKALTLAQIGKDTASAISSLLRGSEATGAAAGPAYPFVKAATFAAGLGQILANVAKAKQLLSSSDSGGSFSSAATTPAASTGSSAQTTPIVQLTGNNTQLNETSQGQARVAGQPQQQNITVTAIVSETEMTSAQNRVSTIQRSAEL